MTEPRPYRGGRGGAHPYPLTVTPTRPFPDMQLLDLSAETLPPGDSMLSEEVSLTPADDPAQIEFYGFDREAFGVTRILLTTFIDSAALQGEENSAIELTLKNKTGTETVFSEVIGQSVAELFRFRALQVPEVISANQSLQVEVNATGAAGIASTTTHDVQVTLVGQGEAQLNARRSFLREQLGTVPERRFVYAPATEIPANTENQPVEVITDPVAGFFQNFAASNADLSVNGRFRLTTETETLVPEMRLDALQGQLLTLPSPYTYEFEPFRPLYAEFTNRQASAVDFSFLAEAFEEDVLERVQELNAEARAGTTTSI